MPYVSYTSMLKEWAIPVSEAILRYITSPAWRPTANNTKAIGKIAVELHLISEVLTEEFDPEIQDLCKRILEILVTIHGVSEPKEEDSEIHAADLIFADNRTVDSHTLLNIPISTASAIPCC